MSLMNEAAYNIFKGLPAKSEWTKQKREAVRKIESKRERYVSRKQRGVERRERERERERERSKQILLTRQVTVNSVFENQNILKT